MNQTEQMREIFFDVIERSGENFKRQFGFSAQADWIVKDLKATLLDEQALAHVNETPKNEHDSDDVLKRAPLVRLTDEEIEALRHQTFSTSNPFCPCDSKTMRKAANAVMDAMIKKNGGNV